jgi:hypothetical protein
VSTLEGRELAKSFGVPFFESSAKNRINVEEAFHELVRVPIVDLNQQSLSCSCIPHTIHFRSEKSAVERFLFQTPAPRRSPGQKCYISPPAAAACSSDASASATADVQLAHRAPHNALGSTLRWAISFGAKISAFMIRRKPT